METKELKINGKLYAKYQLDGRRLYLKTIGQLHVTAHQNEDLIIHLIQLIEKTQLQTVSYLNI